MRRLGMVLSLTLVWIAISGSASPPNALLGFGVALGSLWVLRDQIAPTRLRPRWLKVAALGVIFVRELILSGWRVARLVLSPRMDLRPGIFAYPLKVQSDFEITLLANLITLTPGTLSVDVSEDRRTLFVHAIDCSDVAAAISDIERGFERRIDEAFG